MQMTEQNSGASPAGCKWQSTDWNAVEQHVHRLQMRIAKAVREEHWGKAKALSWLLTHSLYAKMMVVKRVTQNRGCQTAGVDGVILKTPTKREAIKLNLCDGYISKRKNGADRWEFRR
jgi:RNA-directed DNA polymerase